ncbi:hypothetical protein ACE6H2_009636 [Prunus campanulata]
MEENFIDKKQRQLHKHASDQEYKSYGGFGFAGSLDVNHSNGTKGMNNDFGKYTGNSGETTSDQSIALRQQASQYFDSNTGHSQLSWKE